MDNPFYDAGLDSDNNRVHTEFLGRTLVSKKPGNLSHEPQVISRDQYPSSHSLRLVDSRTTV